MWFKYYRIISAINSGPGVNEELSSVTAATNTGTTLPFQRHDLS